MVDYTHKESLREITDEQFTEGTTIDGTRIDSALEDVVNRVNNIRKGDIATRFVQKQFVFGYQPFSYPESETRALDATKLTYRRSFTRFPWTFIANNEHTTIDPQPNAPTIIPDNYEYKAEDYGNRFRFKGTYVDSLHGVESLVTSARLASLNKGPWIHPFWLAWWMKAEGTLGESFSQFVARVEAIDPDTSDKFPTIANYPDGLDRKANLGYTAEVGWPCHKNHYQMAWSHSWAFERPVIVDDLMFFMRTDSAYAADWVADILDSDIADADQLVLQLSVDSPFDYGDRRLNDVLVMQHQVKLKDVLFNPLIVQTKANYAAGSLAVDMAPVCPTAADRFLDGPIIRLQNLNIPIPAGSVVRLGAIIPWFVESGTWKATGDTQTEEYLGGTWPSVQADYFLATQITDSHLAVVAGAVSPEADPLGTNDSTTAKAKGFARAVTSDSPDIATVTTHATSDPATETIEHELEVGDKITILSRSGSGTYPAVGITYAIASVPTASTFTIVVPTPGAHTVPISFVMAKARPSIDQGGWTGAPRWEPMHDWCPGGCLTVLEELVE